MKIYFLEMVHNFDKFEVPEIDTGGTPYDYGIIIKASICSLILKSGL